MPLRRPELLPAPAAAWPLRRSGARRSPWGGLAGLLTGLLLALHLPARAQALAADLQTLLTELGSVGLVVATVSGDRTELLALGAAHGPSQRAMQAGTQVQAGSVVKPVIALALLRLASQGRVSLDAPLLSLLPDLPLHNPWQAEAPLRLRHLLDMTAGLEDARLWQVFNRQHTADLPLAEAWQRQPGVLRLRTPPGREVSYSNLGYTLAGQVIEAVTGERYEAWVERELLAPLGMADSHLRLRQPADTPLMAWGHVEGGVPVPLLPTALRPAGQLTTTAADMARLARFLMSDGRVAGQPFVDPALLAAMGRPETTDAARAGLRSGYALGLVAHDRHGALARCHGGIVAGFRAMLCLHAPSQSAYFWGMNSDIEGSPFARLDARLMAELGWVQPLPAATAADPQFAARPHEPSPGRYPAFSLLERIGASTARQAALMPAGPGLWRLPDRRQTSHARLPDHDGLGERLSDGLRSWRPLSPAWVWAPRLSLALMAAALAGSLLWLPLQAWRRRRWADLAAPTALAAAALLLAGGLVAATGWQALGELTAGSALLAAASVALPLAWGWAAWRALAQRRWGTAALALAVLQGLGLLAAWGLLPLLMWRV